MSLRRHPAPTGSNQPRPPTVLFRLVAILGVVVVLLLDVLTASPSLHARIHGQGGTARTIARPPAGAANLAVPSGHHPGPERTDADEQQCAVSLFANGLAPLLIFFLVVLARPFVRCLALRPVDWPAVAPPRYWHLPAQAPPPA